MKNNLGDRMKRNYEDRTRLKLPRRTHTIIRLDGKAFHTYTRERPKPFDVNMNYHLVNAAAALCQQAQGSLLAYVQSDEISVLLADYATTGTEAWFDGNIQKIASVSASIVTARFNAEEQGFQRSSGQAYFDARVFTIPDAIEVHNYFVWRQKDAIRNSISSAAQAHFSAKQLQGVKTDGMLAMLEGIDRPWGLLPASFRRGTAIGRTGDGKWMASASFLFTEDPAVLDILESYAKGDSDV